jgi:hypothetical protein
MEVFGADYSDIMKIPFTRRQRFIEWKIKRDKEAQSKIGK